MSPAVVCLDPGFAACGWAILRLDPSCDRVEAMGVLRTEKDSRKQKVLATDDNMRRAKELYQGLRAVLARAPGAVAVAAEAMCFTRHASVAAKVSIVWGLVAASPEEVWP